MPGDGPWAAYGGQDEQGPWAKYAGKPGATTANNSIENAAPKLEGSALERGVSGAISGAKALLPDVNPGHMLESAVDTATGAAVPRAIGSAYQDYQANRKIGQGVIPSAASAIGSMVGLDSPGIRDRAAKGDIAGVVGESLPAIAGTVIGGELGGVRSKIGEHMYTPAGELTPGAEALAHPTKLPEYVGRKLFPEPEAQVARREMETTYEQKGSDLMRRGREQDALDRRSERDSRITAREDAVARKAVPLTESPYYNQNEEARQLAIRNSRMAEKEDALARQPVSLTESPYYNQAQEARKFGASERQPVSLAESPYYNQNQAARRFVEGGAGPSNSLAESPNRVPKIGASGAGQPLLGEGSEPLTGSPDDLISRTRAIVRPGEQPSPADLKRAGDLTQAPLGRLKALALWGDELAKNEINRRLQNP